MNGLRDWRLAACIAACVASPAEAQTVAIDVNVPRQAIVANGVNLEGPAASFWRQQPTQQGGEGMSVTLEPHSVNAFYTD